MATILAKVKYTRHMPPPIRFCRSADGARIAFTATGSGPPLVQAPTWMTHLELDWTTSWQPWLAELSRRHVLVRHDLRGCGLSDRDPCRVDLGAWLADLEAVVDTLNLEKFPLFGLCQGAAIAAAYAARHPERVSRLVLYGGYTRGVLARAPRSPQADEARALAKLIETGWGRETPAFRELFARLLMPDAPETTAMAFAEVERQSAVPKMASRLWLAFHHIDIAATAATIAAPTSCRSTDATTSSSRENRRGSVCGSRCTGSWPMRPRRRVAPRFRSRT
jgi:pimeloyl-ACP methyl ester carboxylesterase